jgi:AraC-like DNA-binding protein
LEYRLTFSGRFHYRGGSILSSHYHSDFQIQLVYSGGGDCHINGTQYKIHQGTIIVVPKGSFHDFRVTNPKGMKTVEAKFVSSDPAMETIISQLEFPMEDDGTIFNIMSRIVLEGQRRTFYYKEMSNSLLLECIFLMFRMTHHAPDSVFETSSWNRSEPEKHTEDLLGLVDNYIAKNIQIKISPADIAAACGYNQDYLYRFIRKKTGVSTIRYINQKKFDRAKELIIHTELSLSEISWNLGFETLQYFSRFFKDHAGIPPSEYSNKVRATIRTDYPEDL